MTELWVGWWSNNSINLTTDNYIYGYLGFSLGTACSVLLRGLIFAVFARKVGIFLAKKLLYSILRSPMSWFDVTPSGRIRKKIIEFINL